MSFAELHRTGCKTGAVYLFRKPALYQCTAPFFKYSILLFLNITPLTISSDFLKLNFRRTSFSVMFEGLRRLMFERTQEDR